MHYKKPGCAFLGAMFFPFFVFLVWLQGMVFLTFCCLYTYKDWARLDVDLSYTGALDETRTGNK